MRKKGKIMKNRLKTLFEHPAKIETDEEAGLRMAATGKLDHVTAKVRTPKRDKAGAGFFLINQDTLLGGRNWMTSQPG
jgi:hypothetical protein